MQQGDCLGLVGRTLDGCVDVEAVGGHGGWSVVYRARHRRLGAAVAVKCLVFRERIAPSQQRLCIERFHQEAALARWLAPRASAVVRAYGGGVVTTAHGVLPYAVYEWLEGTTLTQHLGQRLRAGAPRPGIRAAVAMLDELATSLAHVHASGVIHRDIKPSNVFVIQGERLRLLDFGSAKIVGNRGARGEPDVRSLRIMTPAYAAPEQIDESRGPTGPWTDVFALALLLLEVVSGRRPRDVGWPAMPEIGLDDFGLSAPRPVDEVLACALAPSPDDRFADAGVFWGTLKHALEHARGGEIMRSGAYPTLSMDEACTLRDASRTA